MCTIRVGITDFVRRTGDLFLNHSEFPDPQLLKVGIGKQEQDYIPYFGLRGVLPLRGRYQQVDPVDEDLVPLAGEKAIPF